MMHTLKVWLMLMDWDDYDDVNDDVDGCCLC